MDHGKAHDEEGKVDFHLPGRLGIPNGDLFARGGGEGCSQ